MNSGPPWEYPESEESYEWVVHADQYIEDIKREEPRLVDQHPFVIGFVVSYTVFVYVPTVLIGLVVKAALFVACAVVWVIGAVLKAGLKVSDALARVIR